jgi:hypothetical protein
LEKFSFWLYAVEVLIKGQGLILRIDGRYTLVKFYKLPDGYWVLAATYDCVVTKCFGTTKQKAKEIALLRLDRLIHMELPEDEINQLVEKDGFEYLKRK